MRIRQYIQTILPGLMLCCLVALFAYGAEWIEVKLTSQRFIDAMVFAIVVGTAIHSILGLHPRFRAGIAFSAKYLLEFAIVLLGASVSLSVIQTLGSLLLVAVMVIVLLSIVGSYVIGRLMGLPTTQALLVACGNSICGNSAIVAVAPVIGADSDDIACSIAFTATLGIVVVVLLPTIANAFVIDPHQFGVFAGLTVYAVPQVLAATAPVSTLSVHIGTLVKLMRVLMLGPLILLFGVHASQAAEATQPEMTNKTHKLFKIHHLVPWFIIGFFAMIALRTMHYVPDTYMPTIGNLTSLFTIVSMAALGLMVDVKSVFAASGRVLATGVLSIFLLGALSATAIGLLSL